MDAMTSSRARIEALIGRLQLAPHPEGGWYREIFRSAAAVHPQDGRGDRPALTTIFFLLAGGEISRWHRVTSDEVWHLYEGGPLELTVAPPAADRIDRIVLAPALEADGPMHTVPASWWQTARPLGDYALMGCTVGPGFDFADFSFLRDEGELVERLTATAPELVEMV